MKNASLTLISVRASSLVFLAALALAPLSVMAADEKAPAVADKAIPDAAKIAVVDLQALVAESKAGKSIREQLDAQRNTYRGQIEKQEAELSAAEKALVAQQATASKEEFAKKRKEFQEKVMKAQRGVQERRVEFDKAYNKAMEALRENVVKIVADIAGKQSITLVLNRQEVVLVDAKLDLTKQVLAALDAKVTSIPVSVK